MESHAVLDASGHVQVLSLGIYPAGIPLVFQFDFEQWCVPDQGRKAREALFNSILLVHRVHLSAIKVSNIHGQKEWNSLLYNRD